MTPTPPRRRPAPGEYARYYAAYVDKVPEDDPVPVLRAGSERMDALFSALPADKHDHRYAEGKWSVKELLGHMVDTERIFTYRAMCFARGDTTRLPGMDPDDYVNGADFADRSLDSLLSEYRGQRAASLAFFDGFDEAHMDRTGIASDCEFSVRALAHIIAGHERHHLDVLLERYLPAR